MNVAALISLIALTQAGAAPQRVVSASVCADQYVMQLADRSQIAALSWQKDDPLYARGPWVRALPRAAPDAERLLALAPDLVVFGPGEGGRARRMLERFDVPTHEISWTEDFDGVAANIASLAAALGRETRGGALIADIESRRSALTARAAGRGHRPSILYLTPVSGSAGADSYANAAIRLAGGDNVFSNRAGWFTAPPELIGATSPDIVVTSFFRDGYATRQAQRARHPAVRDRLAGPRVEVPGGLWPCAGPRLIEAAEIIADAMDQTVRR